MLPVLCSQTSVKGHFGANVKPLYRLSSSEVYKNLGEQGLSIVDSVPELEGPSQLVVQQGAFAFFYCNSVFIIS